MGRMDEMDKKEAENDAGSPYDSEVAAEAN